MRAGWWAGLVRWAAPSPHGAQPARRPARTASALATSFVGCGWVAGRLRWWPVSGCVGVVAGPLAGLGGGLVGWWVCGAVAVMSPGLLVGVHPGRWGEFGEAVGGDVDVPSA